MAVVTGLGSIASAGTFYVSPSGAQGAGDGSSAANAYGTVQAAYNAAYSTSGSNIIQLLDGTYTASTISAGPFGNSGVINMGGEGGGAGPSGSIVASSITFNGNAANRNAVILSESGAVGNTTGHDGRALFDLYNGPNPSGGISVSNLTVDLAGARDQLVNTNNGGNKITFDNTLLDLTGGVIANQKSFPSDTGSYIFKNSDVHLGKLSTAGTGRTLFGYLWNGFQPNNGDVGYADTFDGSGNSRIYDAANNLVTDLTTIAQEDSQNLTGGLHQDLRNGFRYDQTTTRSLQLDNFVTTAAPEPASLGLIAIGGVGLLVRRRRASAAK